MTPATSDCFSTVPTTCVLEVSTLVKFLRLEQLLSSHPDHADSYMQLPNRHDFLEKLTAPSQVMIHLGNQIDSCDWYH